MQPNMPQRFLRPGITSSRRWNSLDWDAQSFYIRLLTVVDDYGRYEADPQILKSYCFPIREDVTLQCVSNMCSQLKEVKLVEFYSDRDGKPFLQLTKWQERARSHSKFPGPSDNNCCQLQTFASNCKQMLPPSPSPSPSPPSSSSPPPSTTPSPTPPSEPVVGGGFQKLKEMAKEIADQKTEPPSDPFTFLQSELCAFYNRPAQSPWTYAEQSLLAEVARRPGAVEEWRTIKAHADATNRQYFPRSVSRLIEGWSEALDKARNAQPAQARPPGGAQLVAWNQELDRAMKQRAAIRGSYGDHQTPGKHDADRLAKLNARIKELKAALGVQI